MSGPYETSDRIRELEDRALRNTLGLQSHERECAIRYEHITDSVSGIRHDLRVAATSGAGIMLAVLAFLIKLVFFP